MKKGKEFVNRHGHKANLNSIDLSDVSVENDGAIHSDMELDSESLQTPPPVSSKRFSWKWSKRTWLIIGGIAVLLIILPILAGEGLAASYRAGAGSVHNRLQKLVHDKVLPSQKQAIIKASTIGEITAAVEGIRSSTCDGGLADNLAMLYPRAKTAHNECIQKTGQLSNLSTNLKKLEAQSRYIESILNATKTVTAPSTEPFAVITAQQSNWQEARDAVNKLHPPNEWQEQHRTLVRWMSGITEAWLSISTASDTQDKAKFEEAEKALSASYEGIRNIVNELISTVHQTQTDITLSYKKL